ncbi:hypothetical protein BKA82DRAFT_142420 [Pisolithus tinctorius]|uniref:Uncharacterized protein n=1 Tax=Pisolithus tinctorius Marx 270 TaxID=870435 RepID=A0A0C3K581_PISTI|nr:hypothetical protein BKA82DRAFT_142420 [Pisolithus tinctorius]KIO04737.1 hypothetical protein M404DRAFT_142420 [Pisolithus tinctorius Marx 270]
MGTVIYHRQLRSLCTTQETLECAKSILNLASIRTGHGTGFVANAVVLPAVAAYLASEQLNANEVSLQSAATAACVKPRVFEDMLKTVRTALQLDEDKDGQHGPGGDPTYQSLVACHGLYPPTEAVQWMEQAEDTLPQVEMMKRRYGLHVMTGAIFFWVYNLMGNTLAEKMFCVDYNFKPIKFKNILKGLDEHCGTVADLIRSALPKIQASQSTVPPTASSSKFPSIAPFQLPSLSPQKSKSPIKSAMKGKERERELMMSRATSQKRTVVFSQSLLDLDEHVDVPETLTKKCRIESPTKPSLRHGMTLSSVPHEDASIAAFQTALAGPALARPQPSSPRDPPAFPSPRTHNASPTQSPTSAAMTSTPSTSTHLPPVQPLTHPRKRFYPIFMDQQQWVAKDPKVERIWADAVAHWTHMIELYGHPLEHY